MTRLQFHDLGVWWRWLECERCGATQTRRFAVWSGTDWLPIRGESVAGLRVLCANGVACDRRAGRI